MLYRKNLQETRIEQKLEVLCWMLSFCISMVNKFVLHTGMNNEILLKKINVRII